MRWLRSLLGRPCTADVRRQLAVSRLRRTHLVVETLEERTLLSTRISEFALPSADTTPDGITAGPDGNLWFTEAHPTTGNKIGRITPAGTITEFDVPTASSLPARITAGPDGNLWFTEFGAGKIGRISPSGTITEFPLPAADSQPSGITDGLDGNLWFTENAGNKIGRISTSGTVTEFPLPSAASRPGAITAGPDGNVWFVEVTGNGIGRITPSGEISEFTLPTANSAPTSIVTGPDGNLWFTAFGSNQIGRITPGGTITAFATPKAASRPNAITVGPDGALWFTQAGTGVNSIGRLTTEGEFVEEVPVPRLQASPAQITVGRDGNLWFSEVTGSRIGVVHLVDASERFVQAIYQQALGRAASAADQTYWIGVLVDGGTAPVVQGVEHSSEARSRLVQGWYTTYLDRQPDSAGQEYFVNLLQSGATEEEALASLLSSSEYFTHAPQVPGVTESSASNAAFVQALYLQVLERTATATEVSGWVDQLASVDRATVAASVVGSTENRTNIVEDSYGTLLERAEAPSSAEVSAWVLSTLDLRSIRLQMESSVEYYHQGPVHASQRFLQALYQNALGRSASGSDQDTWVDVLVHSGLASVVSGIEQSAEARQHLVQSWFATYLGRQPTSSEGSSLANLLQSGMTEEQVLGDLLGSAEYFDRTPQIVEQSGGSASDETFIQALYAQLLKRTASEGELSYWLGSLPSLGRGGMAGAILGSMEYRSNVVRSSYGTLVRRSGPPSEAEVNGWVLSSLDLRSIRIQMETSAEFFVNG